MIVKKRHVHKIDWINQREKIFHKVAIIRNTMQK
jgi:hypothetical protein